MLKINYVTKDLLYHPLATTGVSDRNITINIGEGEEKQVESNVPNTDHDIFFRVTKSPYITSDWVNNHRKLVYSFVTIVRILFPIWFTLLLFSIIVTRFHYSVDLIVAIIVGLLVSCNTQLIHFLVRFLYRPYYHNYLYNHWYKPVYLKPPLNNEQINYEERVRLTAIGGYI